MKKTYIEPTIEVLSLKMQTVIATSFIGGEQIGLDISDETIEAD